MTESPRRYPSSSAPRRRPSLLLPLAALLALLVAPACSYGHRMLRVTPFSGQELPDADRVNVWPLLYKSGDALAVFWPVFDVDEKGFALRPLMTKEGEEWTIAWPLAGWDAESGEWWCLPAYSTEDNFGIFPVFNTGEWTHIGPVWWDKNDEGEVASWGVVPLFGEGDTLAHVGLVYWNRPQGEDGEPGDVTSWGVFPLAHLGENKGYVMPAWWQTDEAGDYEHLGVLPLFYYQNDKEKERKLFVTPLGGRGWSADDSSKFVNVLGPVFHYSSDGEETFVACAWPIFAMTTTPDATKVAFWPLAEYDSEPDRTKLSMLAGLYKQRSVGDGSGVRFAPLFSYTNGVGRDLWDHLSVFGYHEWEKGNSMHIGTPLVFNYTEWEQGTSWNSLLKVLDYESRGDESEFSFLYYLYRQKRKGEQVRRDFFPFATWDSGPERSGFSFLWRLFRYESVGDRTRGYVLGIPWGDHAEGPAG